ncbi:hypothetical protein [Pseudomonas sp.]|jgi:integrase|uniref:tyrosine-type recombinase/integrase n=1 Tax=Pseudomonas sp. TaxID=306 RepID=UPI00262E0961|nr:hypothetical protein [Pseudomonas sp.]
MEGIAKEAIVRLENDVFTRISNGPISEVDAPLMLDVLRQIEKFGAVNMATRVAAHCSAVFRFAIAKGVVKYNPVPDLRGALKPRIKGHHAAIGTDELPEFLATLVSVEAGMFLQVDNVDLSCHACITVKRAPWPA